MGPAPLNDGLFSGKLGLIISSAWRAWFTELVAQVKAIISTVTISGTGFLHITSGTIDAAAKLVENTDVSNTAGIVESKLSLNYATHSNANDPTVSEKAAFVGTDGTPSAINPFVTDSDSRLTLGTIIKHITAFFYTQLLTDDILGVDNSINEGIEITLLPSAACSGKKLIIFLENDGPTHSGYASIVCDSGSSELLDEGQLVSGVLLLVSGNTVELISDGTYWYVTQKFKIGTNSFTAAAGDHTHNYGLIINSATEKTIPVAADYFPLRNSVDGTLNKLSFDNLKTSIASTVTVPTALIYMGL